MFVLDVCLSAPSWMHHQAVVSMASVTLWETGQPHFPFDSFKSSALRFVTSKRGDRRTKMQTSISCLRWPSVCLWHVSQLPTGCLTSYWSLLSNDMVNGEGHRKETDRDRNLYQEWFSLEGLNLESFTVGPLLDQSILIQRSMMWSSQPTTRCSHVVSSAFPISKILWSFQMTWGFVCMLWWDCGNSLIPSLLCWLIDSVKVSVPSIAALIDEEEISTHIWKWSLKSLSALNTQSCHLCPLRLGNICLHFQKTWQPK